MKSLLRDLNLQCFRPLVEPSGHVTAVQSKVQIHSTETTHSEETTHFYQITVIHFAETTHSEETTHFWTLPTLQKPLAPTTLLFVLQSCPLSSTYRIRTKTSFPSCTTEFHKLHNPSNPRGEMMMIMHTLHKRKKPPWKVHMFKK